MPTYTVHEPALRKGESAPDPERYVFVRDGFHFWAMLLGPVWMLYRRLWLVFFLYAALLVLMTLGLSILGASANVQFFADLALAILVGLEAGNLRRWTYERRGWRTAGIVVADDLEGAEQRFFASLTANGTQGAPVPAPVQRVVYTSSGPAPSSDVLGLFPEPGGGR